MKKLTKALLALSAATMAVSAHSVLAETYVNETFETTGSYKNVISVSRGGGAVWREAENPNGSGKVFEYDLPAGVGVINGDISTALMKDNATITTGRVTFSTDVYIPKRLANGDNINVIANKSDTSAATTVTFANSGTTNSARAYYTNYPVGEWFTVKWTVDYDKKCGTLSVVTKDGEYTVMNSYRASAVTAGLNGIRIGAACGGSEAIKIYFDNIRYYDDPVELAPMTEKVWFNVNPDATGVGAMASGTLIRGGAADANATDSYCEALGKKAVYVDAPGAYHLDYFAKHTGAHFTNRTAGIQYIDFNYYIPEGGIDATSGYIDYQITYPGTSYRAVMRVTAPESTTALNTTMKNTPSAVARAVYGEEFTVRFVWNQTSNNVVAYIVKQDGTSTFAAGPMAINENENYRADGFRVSHVNTKAYITSIKYYDAEIMPNVIDFENGAFTNGGTVKADSSVVQTITGTNGTYWGFETNTVPGSDNMAVKVTSKAGTNADSDAAVKFESYLFAMSAGNDVVTASIDMFIPEALAETEIITYQPLTSNNGTLPINQQGKDESGNKWEQIVGNPFILKGEYAGVGTDGEFSIKYPVGEWFTMAVVYDTVHSEKTEYIIKADGTVIEVGKANANMSRVNTYGIKAHRVHFSKKAGTVTEAEKSFYVDNMKITALNLNDSYLEYNDRDECYEGVVNYSAKGDVTMPSQIVMAGFDADGNYVDCVIFNNTKFFGGNNSYMADIPVDEEGKIADVKMMFVDSVSGLRPFLPVAIVE